VKYDINGNVIIVKPEPEDEPDTAMPIIQIDDTEKETNDPVEAE
jgi:hypothetical protein